MRKKTFTKDGVNYQEAKKNHSITEFIEEEEKSEKKR